MESNQRVEDWLSSRCESPKTVSSYKPYFQIFGDFCRERGRDLFSIVEQWRAAKRQGETEKEIFIEEWNDLIRSYHTVLKKKYAPLSVKNYLSVVKSFLSFWDIPIKVELPRRACVIYHNRDLSREEIKQILTFASPRDRAIWLVMTESGMRGGTAVNLKYWQIRDDFEADRLPMKISLPSSSLKDHVGDRWTFIGEDGFRELKEYLKPRMPLQDDDYVFASEKQGKVKGDQFSVASLSVKFGRIASKLDFSQPRAGKPKRVRMHGLRKYFRNNMKADSAYVIFWMGHSLGVDAHYITRNVEAHRKEYAKGYKFLRIYEPSAESLLDLTTQLRQKEKEIRELKENQTKLAPLLDFINGFDNPQNFKRFMEILKGEFMVQSLEGKGVIHHTDFPSELDKRIEQVAKLEGKFPSQIIEEGVKLFLSKKRKRKT
jgi:integrase